MSRPALIFTVILFIVLPHDVRAQSGPTGADAGSSACTQETDEFKQQTLTRCEPIPAEVEEQPDETIYRARLVLSRVDGQAFLLVYTVSDSWNFLGVDTAYALIDGDNNEFRLAGVDREVNSGQVTEQNAMILDASSLAALASAETVRVKLGRAVLGLPAGSLRGHAQALRVE